MGEQRIKYSHQLRKLRSAASLITALLAIPASSSAAAECVVLLHGLARTPASMQRMADALLERGYVVANVGYPSRKKAIEELAPLAVNTGVSKCPPDVKIHFVTHSLGGILLRYYLKNNEVSWLGRVVMLAPPNNGSEVVDHLRRVPVVVAILGPTFLQLGTDSSSMPFGLGPVEFDLGVIAGTSSFNPLFARQLPNPDDGTVSVASTKVEGMRDFVEVPYSHSFLMKKPAVIAQTLNFIEHGQFEHELAEN